MTEFNVKGARAVLEDALVRIGNPIHHTTECPALNASGRPCVPWDRAAVRWDVWGAINAAPASAPDRVEATLLLGFVIPWRSPHQSFRAAALGAGSSDHSTSLSVLHAAIAQAEHEANPTTPDHERVVQFNASMANRYKTVLRSKRRINRV